VADFDILSDSHCHIRVSGRIVLASSGYAAEELSLA
jgi:hypothetical protein